MDERLGPRFIPVPTQCFKPYSINFIFATVSKHSDSLISTAQVDNVLGLFFYGLFFFFFLSSLEINRSVSNWT